MADNPPVIVTVNNMLGKEEQWTEGDLVTTYAYPGVFKICKFYFNGDGVAEIASLMCVIYPKNQKNNGFEFTPNVDIFKLEKLPLTLSAVKALYKALVGEKYD